MLVILTYSYTLLLQRRACPAGKVAKGHPSAREGCGRHQGCSNGVTDRTFAREPRLPSVGLVPEDPSK